MLVMLDNPDNTLLNSETDKKCDPRVSFGTLADSYDLQINHIPTLLLALRYIHVAREWDWEWNRDRD